LKKSILLKFDQKWCGINQVPAALFLKIAENEKNSKKLATFRFLLALCLLAELLGFFLITLGLSTYWPIGIFFSGIALSIGGAMLAAFFQNKSGAFLSINFQKYITSLKTHSLEIKSFLTENGCSEQEINALRSLPSEVYQSELNSFQRSKILNIGTPLSCGFALLANGDVITSLIVILLGLASFPIGEKFFKENTFRRESELRLGLAAQVLEYVDKIYKEHIWLTTKVNFLSQLPLLLFALRFIWGGSGQLLSSFFGLTQGLAGLTGTLAFQRARVTTMKTTEMTSHLIHALSSPFLIVSPQRWKEHCTDFEKGSSPTELANGVYLKDFTPNVPFQGKEIVSLSCFIPSGSACCLKAHSGKGKSTLLSALTHLIEHTGDFSLVKDHQMIDVHTLSRKEFDSKILYLREENIDNSSRLIDLFKDVIFVENESFLRSSKVHFDPLLVDLAWKAPDNLIEQEIKNIESGKQSAFPLQMLGFLKELRRTQAIQITTFLENAGGNLATERVFPERIFSTLSSGEKRRIVTLIALESCKAQKTVSLVILDEPLTHLDKVNIEHQIDIVGQMLKLPSPPALLIISHHFVEELKESLIEVQEVSL